MPGLEILTDNIEIFAFFSFAIVQALGIISLSIVCFSFPGSRKHGETNGENDFFSFCLLNEVSFHIHLNSTDPSKL